MDNRKYISVEDAIKTTWMILNGLGYTFDENPQLIEAVLAVFDTAQTADVRPVVRGHWIDGACSNCGFFTDVVMSRFFSYCPNCGALMEES